MKTFAFRTGLLAVSLASACAHAQTAGEVQARTPNSAYLQDGRGVIARSPFGLCWRSGTWTPADAVPGCDGELAPPVAVSPIAPALPAQAAAPAPAPAVPPAPKRCDFSVTLASDETFAFNKAVLSGAAKRRIDAEVLPKLAACAKVDIVMITGHADRLGSQQYNQKLSEKRASAVAAYLKTKGVNAEIDTLGVGKTQSVKACDDKLPRARLIECLAPNRRVVVEGRGLAR
ncbi:OmpA family protein [Noviherbaspirillum galbum]|uniref:OmpA family protein n=1 Tax=Noviherbaspirillum galbum TaxID=2709383 RepID=A0A6B3SQD2_9BURK|nr:OmpA family protein [Noviherbaspirillum galbum]NEX60622.1 OmpA family protein [Noviherbaspirillum galbum]